VSPAGGHGLAGTPVQGMPVPSFTDVAGDRVRVRPAAGLQLMELEGPRAQNATRISKRAFDLVGAAVLLVLASPLLIATAIAIPGSSPAANSLPTETSAIAP